jgi:hypothetical protein
MSSRKRGLLALGAALAAGVLAAVALGQEVVVPIRLTATVKVTPGKAGTPHHPQGVRIDVRGTIDTPAGTASMVPQSVDVWFPKGWRYNGAKHPVCALKTLSGGGPDRCPPRSIMGRSPLTVEPPDATSPPHVTIINGGPTKMYFWVVVHNPARVQAPVVGTMTQLSSPRWSYWLHADIPASLQAVAGIPLTLNSFHAIIGHGDWIATTHCPPDHRWHYHLKLTSTSGQAADTGGSVTCRS